MITGGIIVKRRINVSGTDNANKIIKKPVFKNNGPVRLCISKINNSSVDSAEDLDIVMPMYSLLEHSHNYSINSGSL